MSQLYYVMTLVQLGVVVYSICAILNLTIPPFLLVRAEGELQTYSVQLGLQQIVETNKQSCPGVCTSTSRVNVADYTHKMLDSIPQDIPTSCTTLRLGCNLLKKIPPKAFQNLINLECMELNNNEIRNVDELAFFGLRNLVILSFKTNKISNVSSQMFFNLPRLQHLVLTDNLLKTIPDLCFATALTKLWLDTNHIQKATFPACFANLKNLSTIILTNNKLQIIQNPDFHFLHKESIRTIKVARCSLATIDAGVFALPKLQSLDFSYNPDLNIASLRNVFTSVSSFKKPLLKSLQLEGVFHQSSLPADLFSYLNNVPVNILFISNWILTTGTTTAVKNGTFSYFPKLEILDFSRSKISTIEMGVFTENLTSIIELRLQENQLSEVPAMKLPTLQKLNLAQNLGINKLINNMFANMPNLTQLVLKSCQIKQVSTGAFNGLLGLQKLCLSGNGLSGNSLSPKHFQSMPKLVELDLSNNIKMSNMKDEHALFSALTYLKKLDMSGNNCSSISLKIFHPLKQLNSLNLKGNSLRYVIDGDVDGELFSGLSCLHTLILSYNGLVTVPAMLIKDLVSLQTLDLSSNLLVSWPANFMPVIAAIEGPKINTTSVNFAGNKISIVTEMEFGTLPNYVNVNLYQNLFACSCDMIWFRHWIAKHNDTASKRLENLAKYTCNSPKEMASKLFLDFCPDDIKMSCFPPPWIWILVAVGGSVVPISLFTSTMAYRYRWPLRLKWYHFCRWARMKSTQPDGYGPIDGAVYKYDVMVSYGPSERDRSWVKECLIETLGLWEITARQNSSDDNEQGFESQQSVEVDGVYQRSDSNPHSPIVDGSFSKNDVKPQLAQDQQRWNMFFEERDVAFNKSGIGQVSDAIQSSQKILIVLSHDYLMDNRRQFEIDLAISSCCDRSIGLSGIIVVKLDSDADINMPYALHSLASKGQVLEWTGREGDSESFWTHLREQLPVPIQCSSHLLHENIAVNA